jgi:hypothetical protein
MRFDLTDTQFEQIHALFPNGIETRGRKPIDIRQVINGIFYILIPILSLNDVFNIWEIGERFHPRRICLYPTQSLN